MTILPNILTIFQLMQASFDSFCLCPMPDAHLDYRDLLQSTMKVFPFQDFFHAPCPLDIKNQGRPFF